VVELSGFCLFFVVAKNEHVFILEFQTFRRR
jgi:hypothetical protein